MLESGKSRFVHFCVTLLIASWCTGPALTQTPELSEAAAPVLAVAMEQLERLAERSDTPQAPRRMLLRNLSRFFTLYLIPTDTDELGRVLGAVERKTQRAVVEIYRAAEAMARKDGSETIRRTHVEQSVADLLPSRDNDYAERVFFLEAAEPVVIEKVDLQAFYDTGFCWEIMGFLAELEIHPDDSALPLESAAVPELARGANAYGLLLLRIGGAYAKHSYATHLQTRHLREAGKFIDERGATPIEESARRAESPASTPYFTEITAESGIDYRHVTSNWLARFRRYGRTSPTFSGGGVAVADLDGDDRLDMVICGGGGCRAFKGRPDGTFGEMTAAAALEIAGEGRMAVVADFDNDGLQDVFISYARDTNRIFHNPGGGRFQDVTAGSGLERQGDISGASIAVDYDNDGLLDIYVGNFGDYLAGATPWTPNANKNGQPNRLYRNLGNLKFEDVTESAGVGDTGWAQALSHLDYDNDGDQDLYVANDFGPNELLINNGDGTFTSGGEFTGTDDGSHGMNVALSDLNRDLYPDIFVTNIWSWNPALREVDETNSLLLSSVGPDGGVVFQRYEGREFLDHDTGWSWGGVFFDADNDGDDDLYVVNGLTDYYTSIQYRQSPIHPDELYAINNGREPNNFFRNDSGLPVVLVPSSGAELDNINSRSVALLDYDRDGDLDMVVTTFHSRTRLFRNDFAPTGNHWLAVELEGDPQQGTSRDAVGTQVIARGADGFYCWRMRAGGDGYLGMGSPAQEMGLGQVTTVDLEVIWPGRKRQTFDNVAADQRILIRQGHSEIEVLPFD